MTVTDPAPDADIDEQAAEEFAGRLFELFTGATLKLPDRHRAPYRTTRCRHPGPGHERRAG